MTRGAVAWRASQIAHSGFLLDALEHALYVLRPTHGGGYVHHSVGSQHVSIRYYEGLEDAGSSHLSQASAAAAPTPFQNCSTVLKDRCHSSLWTIAQLRGDDILRPDMGLICSVIDDILSLSGIYR